MADYSGYLLANEENLGTFSYVTSHTAFVNATEGVATEVENAREDENTLIENLQNNYATYILKNNVDGGALLGRVDDDPLCTGTTIIDTDATFTADMVGEYIVNITQSLAEGTVVKVQVVGYTDENTITTAALPNGGTWQNDKYSLGGKRCINMSDPYPLGIDEGSNTYVTKEYINGLSGTGVASLYNVSSGNLAANSILVVDSSGEYITSRGERITKIYPFTNATNNDVIATLTSGGIFWLPIGTIGAVITFNDIFRIINSIGSLIIAPFDGSGDKIMGKPLLHITEFTGIYFKLLFVGGSNGWVITDLQR